MSKFTAQFSQWQVVMKPSKRLIGTKFEEKAAHELLKKGYEILEKNVNYRWGEIDIIAVDPGKKELVFVEVRHRAQNSMTSAEESVSKTKQVRLKRAINTYLVSSQYDQRGLKLDGVRIDLIAFYGDELTHWKNFI